MANTHRPTVDQLKQALKISEQIQALEAELAAILGSAAPKTLKRAYTKKGKAAPAKKTKRTMSPEAKEKIAAAQRARWAKQKKAAK